MMRKYIVIFLLACLVPQGAHARCSFWEIFKEVATLLNYRCHHNLFVFQNKLPKPTHPAYKSPAKTDSVQETTVVIPVEQSKALETRSVYMTDKNKAAARVAALNICKTSFRQYTKHADNFYQFADLGLGCVDRIANIGELYLSIPFLRSQQSVAAVVGILHYSNNSHNPNVDIISSLMDSHLLTRELTAEERENIHTLAYFSSRVFLAESQTAINQSIAIVEAARAHPGIDVVETVVPIVFMLPDTAIYAVLEGETEISDSGEDYTYQTSVFHAENYRRDEIRSQFHQLRQQALAWGQEALALAPHLRGGVDGARMFASDSVSSFDDYSEDALIHFIFRDEPGAFLITRMFAFGHLVSITAAMVSGAGYIAPIDYSMNYSYVNNPYSEYVHTTLLPQSVRMAQNAAVRNGAVFLLSHFARPAGEPEVTPPAHPPHDEM